MFNYLKNHILKILQTFVGLNFTVSGLFKCINFFEFKLVLYSYFPHNSNILTIAGIFIVLLQVVIGILIITNYLSKISTIIGIISLAFMIALLITNWGTILPFGCGCLQLKNEPVLVSYYHIIYDFFLGGILIACYVKK